MAIPFPSEEWVVEYKKVLDTSEDYKKAGQGWEAGAITLVVNKNPEIGMNEDIYLWLDLHKGICREAKIVNAEDGKKAPFVITADYTQWKQVVKKELDPIKGMMQGKLKLKGDLPTIVRHVKAAQELVECCSKVPTSFLDEK